MASVKHVRHLSCGSLNALSSVLIRLHEACRFTETRCQHEQQPCQIKQETGHCGYLCRMQHLSALHGSLLHAWGPILSVAALSGVQRRRRTRGVIPGTDNDADELIGVEWIDEAGIEDDEGVMRRDAEELMHLALSPAAPERVQYAPWP